MRVFDTYVCPIDDRRLVRGNAVIYPVMYVNAFSLSKILYFCMYCICIRIYPCFNYMLYQKMRLNMGEISCAHNNRIIIGVLIFTLCSYVHDTQYKQIVCF